MEYKEFGNYKVFENGDILYKEKVVKKYLNKRDGYISIKLFDDIEGLNGGWINKKQKGKQFRLHRIVYTLFIGQIPENYSIHHIDKNKNNNHYKNLICVSKSKHLSIHMNKGLGSIKNTKEYKRDYYKINKEYIREKVKQYCIENKERIKLLKKRWYEKNKSIV